MSSSFHLIAKTKLNGRIPVYKYKSKETGLTVILADVDGPVVQGYFALATEAHDDDGLPHTLEHLVFLGSESYPFKGVLDLLANRCLASGTNAWTDTDHTCYTITTAGSDGFLSLLPIYLDHILYPTLTESGFITEVHHINGDGEDAGVVYCEMQGRENSDESRTFLELLRAIYPNSGYCSETGGIMKNLRTSTSIKKVRDYHREFYRPENLAVIITGKVLPEEVFSALQPIEEKIIKKGPRGNYTRPWQTPVEPLKMSENKKIYYPSDDEDCGLVYVGWRGPKCATEHLTLTACAILLRYLSDTSISPLQREFVEIEDPFASQVHYEISENSESLLYLRFENVPLEKMKKVSHRLQEILTDFVTGKEKMDMKRMGNIIEKQVLEAYSGLENNPHEAVAFMVIGDFLYGNSEEDFQSRLNVVHEYTVLREKKDDFWIDLIRRFLVESFHIVIRSYPSIKEQQRMSTEELERIEKQRQALGPEGLKAKGKTLQRAIHENDKSASPDMLTMVPIPTTDKIHFYEMKKIKPSHAEQIEGFNLNDLLVYSEAYWINTNFVYMTLTLDTEDLVPAQRSYLLLFLELLMESPIMRNGELIPYEDVVEALESDTIDASRHLGLEQSNRFICGPFSNSALISVQVEPKKYAKGVNWIKEILFLTEFIPDRIRVCAAKMANDVAQAKRVGDAMLKSLLKGIVYNQGTNVHMNSILNQHKFLTKILADLEDPEKVVKIIDDLNEIRSILTRPDNLAIHIAADWDRLRDINKDLLGPWHELIKSHKYELKDPRRELKFFPDWRIIDPSRKLENDTLGQIVGMGSVESSFLLQVVPSIKDFLDPDLPALMLFLQYLTQLEGPLWRQIRGQGLSYHYSIIPRPHEGLLCLMFYKSTSLVAAYKETQSIIEAHIANDDFEQNLFDSARSSLIFEVIDREKTIGDLVDQSLLSSFKQVPVKYNYLLVQKIGQLSRKDLARVGKKYVAPLFTDMARTAIVCNPDKATELQTAFAEMGRPLDVKITIEESVLKN